MLIAVDQQNARRLQEVVLLLEVGDVAPIAVNIVRLPVQVRGVGTGQFQEVFHLLGGPGGRQHQDDLERLPERSQRGPRRLTERVDAAGGEIDRLAQHVKGPQTSEAEDVDQEQDEQQQDTAEDDVVAVQQAAHQAAGPLGPARQIQRQEQQHQAGDEGQAGPDQAPGLFTPVAQTASEDGVVFGRERQRQTEQGSGQAGDGSPGHDLEAVLAQRAVIAAILTDDDEQSDDQRGQRQGQGPVEDRPTQCHASLRVEQVDQGDGEDQSHGQQNGADTASRAEQPRRDAVRGRGVRTRHGNHSCAGQTVSRLTSTCVLPGSWSSGTGRRRSATAGRSGREASVCR